MRHEGGSCPIMDVDAARSSLAGSRSPENIFYLGKRLFFLFFFFEEGKSTRAVLLVHVVSRLLSLTARRQRACSGVHGAVAQGMRSDHVGIINALTNRFHIFGSGFHSFGVTV